MIKNHFLLMVVFGIIFCLSGCSSKNPSKAPELKGEALEDFLNSPIKYGPLFHNDYVKDVFYSSDVVEDVNVLVPRNLGTKDSIKHIAIIIEGDGKSTILYFEGKKMFPDSSVYEYTFTKLEQGELVRYQNKMNPILVEIFPNEYFRQIAIEIEDYEKSEPEREAEREKQMEVAAASFRTPGRPKDLVLGLDLKKEIGVMIGHVPTFKEHDSTTPSRNLWTPYSNRGDRNIKEGIYTFNFSRNTIINEFKPFLDWFRKDDEMAGGVKFHNNEDELFISVMFFLNQKSNNSITEDQIGHPIFRSVSTDNSYRIFVYGYKDQSGAEKNIAVVIYNI